MGVLVDAFDLFHEINVISLLEGLLEKSLMKSNSNVSLCMKVSKKRFENSEIDAKSN